MSARADQNLLSDKATVLTPHSSVAETASFSGTDPHPPLPPAFSEKSLGRYRVVRLLGQGAFGSVYLAEDTALGRQVAVKVTSTSHKASAVCDSLREAQTLAKLDHPAIVPVYDLGSLPSGENFTVAKYIRGQSLAERLVQGPMTPSEAAQIVTQVCEGLQHAHQQGVFHRDIKPANILLDDKRNALVADFGLAVMEGDQHTRRGEVSGSPGYMSPEQVRGDAHLLDGRTDIWSVGVILYEALTGRRPYSDTSREQLFEEILHRDPKPLRLIDPAIPLELERITLRCLRKDIADRYATAADVATELRGWLTTEQMPVPQGDKQSSRGLTVLVGGGIALLLMVGVAIWRFADHSSAPGPEKKGLDNAAQLPVPTPQTKSADPVMGTISLRIWSPKNPARRGKLLDELGMLPLEQGDQIRVEAELSRPAYAYILWIDGQGKVSPVYPWTPGDWKRRPAQETKIAKISLPEQLDTGWELEPGTGMETLLLLGKEEPLEQDFDLQTVLADLPSQSQQDPRSLAWFENGLPKQDQLRGPRFFDPQRIDDPLLKTHQALQGRLGRRFSFLRAVSFASRSE